MALIQILLQEVLKCFIHIILLQIIKNKFKVLKNFKVITIEVVITRYLTEILIYCTV